MVLIKKCIDGEAQNETLPYLKHNLTAEERQQFQTKKQQQK